MGILLDGFRKQKRYTTNANGDHQLVSTWTHSDTVIMPDGTLLSEAVLGDGNDAVRQTETVNGNDDYEILLSQTADDTTRTEGARKSSKLKFNPYTSSLITMTSNGRVTLTPNQLTISGVGGEGSLTKDSLVLSNSGISTTYSNSDIVTDSHNTWDGTNTSLKTAVTNAKGTVTQTETTTNDYYELLFSGTADDTTRTEAARKSAYLKINPSNKSLNIVNEYNDTNYKSVAVSPTGVNVLSAENGVHNLRYGADDIVFNAPSNPPTWDGTNTSLKAAIAAAASTGGGGVAVPPVIFDNGNLKKVNDVDGFPGLEKVFLTPTSYEALTQTEKEDLGKIYYVSEYDYYSDKGGTLVLRVKNDEIKLFVNGFVDEKTQLEDGNFVGVINDKIRELIGSYFIGSIAYDENKEPIGGSLPYVYIDANYSRIAFRNASGDSSRVINTITYAVIDLTNYSQGQGSVLQSNPWEDPYDISGGMTIYYGDKQYSNFNMPDVNSVQVPPVIFDNGSLKKINNMNEFPGLEKIYTTPTKYTALSDDEKKDLGKIYYVSDYEFYSDPDNPVVVRVDGNGDALWFFNGYTFANNARYEVPENLREFQAPLNAQSTRHVRCDSTPYASPDATSPISSDYFVGWNPSDQLNQMRYSRITSTSASIRNGTVYAVINPNGGAEQTNPYTDPYDIPGGFTIYYGGKQYSEYEIPTPDINAVQVPPVIFDNGKLMKISDMTGFPELEKVFVTSEEYSQLTTAQKQDLSKIYYVSPYKFYSFEDGKIIIRTNDNETKWYFNGFEVPSDGTYNVPSEMSSYFAANQASNAYSDETSETDLGYIELGLNVGVNVIYFQQGLWGGSWIAAGTPVWGVVSKNGGDNQQNTYSDPYDTETPVLIYYGGKQYTEYEPAKPYVELTQAEYDALPSSKESDGIIYFING